LGLINKEDDDDDDSGRYSKFKKPVLHGVTVAGLATASWSHNDGSYKEKEISSPDEIAQRTIAPELALLTHAYVQTDNQKEIFGYEP
jgi:hypothetical protein